MILEEHKNEIIPLIDEAHQTGARYSKACNVVGISLRTLQRWKSGGREDKRKGASKRVVRKLSAATRQEVIAECNSQRFCDHNPHKIVPLLLNEGRYIASVRTFYRILKEEKLLHHRSNTQVRKKRSKPPERKATKSNQVWCWDITWMSRDVRGLFYYAYVITDIFDKSIVGWAVHDRESDAHSRELFDCTLNGRHIALKALHADNGGPMKGVTLMALLRDLKVEVSHNRPRTSNDNPFIESLFKTLKYQVTYPLQFKDIGHAREWMASFVNWYNTEHLHSAIDYVTPEQMRSNQAAAIFEKRNETMQDAQAENPERWGSRKAKWWGAPKEVVLNKDYSNEVISTRVITSG